MVSFRHDNSVLSAVVLRAQSPYERIWYANPPKLSSFILAVVNGQKIILGVNLASSFTFESNRNRNTILEVAM